MLYRRLEDELCLYNYLIYRRLADGLCIYNDLILEILGIEDGVEIEIDDINNALNHYDIKRQRKEKLNKLC